MAVTTALGWSLLGPKVQPSTSNSEGTLMPARSTSQVLRVQLSALAESMRPDEIFHSSREDELDSLSLLQEQLQVQLQE